MGTGTSDGQYFADGYEEASAQYPVLRTALAKAKETLASYDGQPEEFNQDATSQGNRAMEISAAVPRREIPTQQAEALPPITVTANEQLPNNASSTEGTTPQPSFYQSLTDHLAYLDQVLPGSDVSTAGKALSNALSFAQFAIPAGRNMPQFKPSTEYTIGRQPSPSLPMQEPLDAAAIKFQAADGKNYTFTGVNHGEAWDAAESQLGGLMPNMGITEGFTTKSGAFLNRKEAAQSIGRSGYLRSEDAQLQQRPDQGGNPVKQQAQQEQPPKAANDNSYMDQRVLQIQKNLEKNSPAEHLVDMYNKEKEFFSTIDLKGMSPAQREYQEAQHQLALTRIYDQIRQRRIDKLNEGIKSGKLTEDGVIKDPYSDALIDQWWNNAPWAEKKKAMFRVIKGDKE